MPVVPSLTAHKRSGPAACLDKTPKVPKTCPFIKQDDRSLLADKPFKRPSAPGKAAVHPRIQLESGIAEAVAMPTVSTTVLSFVQRRAAQDAGVPYRVTADGETGDAAFTKPIRNRTRAGDLDPAEVEAKILQKYAENLLEKLSIPEIKIFLKAKKLPLGGKKADLVARLGEYLSSSKRA
jgi:hypothetical protein